VTLGVFHVLDALTVSKKPYYNIKPIGAALDMKAQWTWPALLRMSAGTSHSR